MIVSQGSPWFLVELCPVWHSVLLFVRDLPTHPAAIRNFKRLQYTGPSGQWVWDFFEETFRAVGSLFCLGLQN